MEPRVFISKARNELTIDVFFTNLTLFNKKREKTFTVDCSPDDDKGQFFCLSNYQPLVASSSIIRSSLWTGFQVENTAFFPFLFEITTVRFNPNQLSNYFPLSFLSSNDTSSHTRILIDFRRCRCSMFDTISEIRSSNYVIDHYWLVFCQLFQCCFCKY